MNKVLRRSKMFLDRNSSTILTCIGGMGVIATTVMAIKATPKALKRIEEAKEEKGDELTKFEVVKATAPVYIPTIVTGAATLTCIFGANVLNKRKQAALMSAYALLDQSYKDYRGKVIELYGTDAHNAVQAELARDAYEKEENPLEVEDGNQLFYDSFSGRYFETTMEKVLKAEYELNRIFSTSGYACLNEFYEDLGLERADYGDELGWSTYEMGEMYMHTWLDFTHTKAEMDDGLECCIIEMVYPPTVGFMEY